MDDHTNDSDGCEYGDGDALAGRLSGPCPGVECDRCGATIDADPPATLDEEEEGGTCSACAEREGVIRRWWAEDCQWSGGARRFVVGDGAVYVSDAVTLDSILDQYPWDRVGREDGAELTEAIDAASADHGGAYWAEADEETVDGAYVHAVRYHHGDDWRKVINAAIRRALDDARADAEVREAVLRGIVPSDDGTLGDGTHRERVALDPDGLATQAASWVESYTESITDARRDEADEEVE